MTDRRYSKVTDRKPILEFAALKAEVEKLQINADMSEERAFV